jgi:hypothetical protein
MTTLTLSQRRSIRAAANSSINNVHIQIVTGIQAPEFTGRPYWKTNFTRHYPSGKTFSRTLYTPSTQRVVVGAEWIAAQSGA